MLGRRAWLESSWNLSRLICLKGEWDMEVQFLKDVLHNSEIESRSQIGPIKSRSGY